MEYLKGVVTHVYGNFIVLENPIGEGVKVFVPDTEAFTKFQTHRLFIYRDLRIDRNLIVCSLYGFLDPRSLEFFKFLMNVKGIGTKTALEVLRDPIDPLIDFLLTQNIIGVLSIQALHKYAEDLINLSKKPSNRNFLMEIKCWDEGADIG